MDKTSEVAIHLTFKTFGGAYDFQFSKAGEIRGSNL